jgi:tRNA/tmRNA/rRNA uracil-C5-methylase (TrmA/RlmC/RlmD family)
MAALICPHQPSCPGCPRLAQLGPEPGAVTRLTALAVRLGAAPPEVKRGPSTGFRRRARLAIRGRADAPKLGIFQSGTHRAVHIPRCLVHHPVINRVAAQVRDSLARQRVPTYSDQAHAGVVRYVQIVVERQTELAQVSLITNQTAPDGLDPLLADLQSAIGPQLHGLWWNGNPERTNTILGPHWRHIAGQQHVEDYSGSARLFYPPHAFGQSNLDLAMQLAADVRALSRPGERVLELYAGVGAIGLGLAASAGELWLNELAEGSLQGLALGVAALPAEQAAKVRVVPGPAGDAASLVAGRDLVIADPPRKGLDAGLLQALRAAPPARFAYVSCDAGSLERDAAQLEGSFRLSSLTLYDLFPHTEHVESLAVFERLG